jgi:hypothetical protein
LIREGAWQAVLSGGRGVDGENIAYFLGKLLGGTAAAQAALTGSLRLGLRALISSAAIAEVMTGLTRGPGAVRRGVVIRAEILEKDYRVREFQLLFLKQKGLPRSLDGTIQ